MSLLRGTRRALLGRRRNPWYDPLGESLCVWAAYRAKGAGSFAQSLIDLSGNGRDAGDPGGAATPGWDAVNGWVLDGIADYLTTTFVAQNDQSQSVLIQFTGGAAGINRFIFGSDDGANRLFQILPSSIGPLTRYRNGGNSNGPAGAGFTVGNVGIAGNQGYKNGVDDTAVNIPAWVGAAVSACYIGCENAAGVPGGFYLCNIQAFAFYDCVLTPAQVLTVATAMARL